MQIKTMVITAIVVLTFGALVWSHLGVSEDGILIPEQVQSSEPYTGSFNEDNTWEEYVEKAPVTLEPEALSDDILNGSSDYNFGEAFREARLLLGPGETFYWYGREYTTDYLEEVNVEEKPKSSDVNIVDVIEPVILDSINSLVTPEQ
jgi:hypothetical protein